MTEPTVRFAPSPTGLLHVGNARTALLNWLFARAHGGRLLLRLDDTDVERSTVAFAAAIEEDLRWLGLDWDGRCRQSDRFGRYEGAFEALRAAGRVYACYETAEELAAKRRERRARGLAPVYDRAGRRLSDGEHRAYEAAGRRAHWRFALRQGEIAWDDLVQGAKRFEGGRLSDPVVRRADGSPTYIFASAVDDVELRVTHVIRGEDHVSNTPVQIDILAALGGQVPAFGHLPLLVDAAGKGLSKRLGSLSLRALREERGIEPAAVDAYLAALGTGEAARVVHDPRELVEGFELGRYGRAPPRFDLKDLEALSAKVVRGLPFERARARLRALGLDEADAAFWAVVRPNLGRVEDAAEWWAVCRRPLAPVVEEPEYLARAAELLPPEPWGEGTFAAWTEALKAGTGRRGKALFRPLRLALTGREHGPELRLLLPLLGRERAFSRLRGDIY